MRFTLDPKMKLTVRKSKSPLGFSTDGTGAWKEWDRFITIEGKKAYHIGNICGTCAFFFERHTGANQCLSPQGLREELTTGIARLNDSHLKTLEELLPNGDYEFSLRKTIPKLITPGTDDDYFVREQPALWGVDGFWGLPHNPRTKYYRGSDRDIGGGERLYEFLIPMFPETWLKDGQVSEFRDRLERGDCPTALAISVLDVKQPADWEGDPEVNCHWCLAHYLIDGHHKVFAAALTGRPISFISMLATAKGISGPGHHVKITNQNEPVATVDSTC
jgi:hypothetical protein